MPIGPKGGSCGTAVYRREPVYVTDIRTDPVWDHYRHLLLPFGIRAVWSRPLFTNDGKVLGTFAIHYREARSPNAIDLQLIDSASQIAGIAIERQLNEEKLRRERDRLQLLLEITSSVTSRLDLRQVVEALSTNLFRIMQCDVSALLLPDSESGELRVTILHNPDARGPYREGSLVSMDSSISGQVLRKGKSIRIDSFEQVREDPEIYGNPEGQRIYERVIEEGLSVGCYLPLVSRDRVVGVLMLCRRSNSPFEKDDVILLEQVACQIAIAVENTLEYERATKDRDKETKQRLYLEEEVRAEFGAIVGDSPALKGALHLVSVVAPTDSSVMIQGETGTGKELIARAIHNLSGRRERAFVKLNCAAIPLGLLESELFGHEKGAFTGAIAQKTGRFELAHKGTLFLDEVGDIPLELQAKLLRVLQEQEFERLGSNRTHKVDVRLIAATHRDLAAMVKQSTFREDLYYRLKVFPIHVPALRQRTEDIPKLTWYFTELYMRRMNRRIETIPSETMDALVRYRWPGNVRELQNFIERAVILSPHTVLRAPTSELEPFSAPTKSNLPITGLEELERDHIVRVLQASNWVVGGRNGAAERLGMKRTSLVYKMRKLRIARPAPAQENGTVGSRLREA
jgi:formate hydrogenlyase transcriptional activator